MPSTNQSKMTQFVRVYRKRPGRPKGAASSGAAVAQGSNSSAASASDAVDECGKSLELSRTAGEAR